MENFIGIQWQAKNNANARSRRDEGTRRRRLDMGQEREQGGAGDGGTAKQLTGRGYHRPYGKVKEPTYKRYGYMNESNTLNVKNNLGYKRDWE